MIWIGGQSSLYSKLFAFSIPNIPLSNHCVALTIQNRHPLPPWQCSSAQLKFMLCQPNWDLLLHAWQQPIFIYDNLRTGTRRIVHVDMARSNVADKRSYFVVNRAFLPCGNHFTWKPHFPNEPTSRPMGPTCPHFCRRERSRFSLPSSTPGYGNERWIGKSWYQIHPY